jgi:hypothetical protein
MTTTSIQPVSDTLGCPILAVFDKLDVNYFGEVGVQCDEWTYVSYLDDSNPDRRQFDHYAVKGTEFKKLDFTGFQKMSPLVFSWMVEMDFPTRHDLAFASHFSLPAKSPLTRFDVERIWLWWKLHNLQGK